MKRKSKRVKKETSEVASRETPEGVLYLTTFEVTDRPIMDRAYRKLPGRVKGEIEDLHLESQIRPRRALNRVLELKARYPNIRQLDNYLSVCYSRMGDLQAAEEVIRESLERYPDYLFAKINLAQIYLARKEHERIPELFGEHLDLATLYPERKRFHISEVVNFVGMVGIYLCRIGAWDAAAVQYEFLAEVAPEYPLVQSLKKELRKGRLWRWLRRVIGRS